MAAATSFAGFTVNDNTLNRKTQRPERTRTEFAVVDIDDTNLLDQEALVIALRTAFANVIIGVMARTELIAERTALSNTRASSTLAQRENKWLCRYHSVESIPLHFTLSIGTADLTKLTDGEEFLSLTGGVGLALKNAFQAVVVSPDDSSVAVILDSVQFVGRNT